MSAERKPEISIGDGMVVVKRPGQSRSVVACILGMELDAQGRPVTIWLDRIVHRLFEDSFEGWRVSGAVSTVLSRQGQSSVS